MKTIVMAMMVVLALISSDSLGTVLTFDDIGAVEESTPIPDGYGGFNWEDFYYMNVPEQWPDSGYNNGLVSGDYVAFPSTYENPGTGRILGELFTFNGAYLTGAWRDGLNIQVDGYLDDVHIYSTTVVVDTSGPTWFDFDYVGIDELAFSASGGIPSENYTYQVGTHFAIDNFTFTDVPEPATISIFAVGLLFMSKRKQE